MEEAQANKRRRVDDDETENEKYEKDIEKSLKKIAKLNKLYKDTLCHDTYCPLFLKFFGMRFIVNNIILISKYHRNLVLNHPASLPLCRSIAYYDYGTFLTLSPFNKQFRHPSVTNGQTLISKLYLELPEQFVAKPKQWNTKYSGISSLNIRCTFFTC